jgi:hypothetical protein
MIVPIRRLLSMSFTATRTRLVYLVLPGALAGAFGLAAFSQQTTPANPAPSSTPPDVAQQPAAPATTPAAAQQAPGSPAQDAAPPPAAPQQPAQEQAAPGAANGSQAGGQSAPKPAGSEGAGVISEEQLKQLLVGKDLFLRGGYLGDSITFNEHGTLNGHAPSGSYTLCGVRIDKIRLTKHKVELEGARYGLHFLGALPYEDPTKAVDRVRITPKKKVLRLTIDREIVVKAKKVKEDKSAKGKGRGPAATSGAGAAASAGTAAEPAEMSDADQLKAEIAATPEAERPADPKSVTTTTSPEHAKNVLLEALDKVFASRLDDRMLAQMPKFWRLYYQAAEAKTDFSPADPAVLRQTTVDQKAKLLSTFEPGSNEYAQANGVAGMALYHVVIGADGKPAEIAVARPIGFGLDENAVESISKASFAPAVKDGKPVPVLLDLVVQFRIYSKRTAANGVPEPQDKSVAPVLPGPYSVEHP